MRQDRGIAAILAAAAVCLMLAATGLYGAYAILDRDAFADRAASTLGSDEVRQEVAARFAMRVVQEHPGLVRAQSAVEEAAGRVIVADEFRAPYRAGALRLHDALLADADAEAALRVAGSGSDVQR